MFKSKWVNWILFAVLMGICLTVTMPVLAQDGTGGEAPVVVISQSVAVLFFVGVVIVLGTMFAGLVYFARQAGIAVSPAMVGVFAEQIKDLAKSAVENAKTDAEKTPQPWDDLGVTIADTIVKALTPLFDRAIGEPAGEPIAPQSMGKPEADPGATKPVTVVPGEGLQGIGEETQMQPPLGDLYDADWWKDRAKQVGEEAIPPQERRTGNWTDEAPK